MSEREWYPAGWVDEVCPPSRSAPSGFIVPVLGGFELGYTDPQERELHNQPLKVGDVVEFVACDRMQDIEATLRADGTYELHGTIPSGHNAVLVDGDIDTLQETFEKLIEAIKTDHEYLNPRELIFCDGETEKRVTLQFANWSDPQSFFFEIANGQPAFTPVPPQKN